MANRNQDQNPGSTPRSGTSNRGFASMDEDQQREIARMGGAAVSGNREHMAAIGRKGGEASAESRAAQRASQATARKSGDEPTADTSVDRSASLRVRPADADGYSTRAQDNDHARKPDHEVVRGPDTSDVGGRVGGRKDDGSGSRH